jgi:5'-deoxynucleotidase YfbR-like HD superfamily hydrolase
MIQDYITTYTKIHFTPLAPRPEQVNIRDIAHALSMLTRANGHFPEFYSVAQHCIQCGKEAIARGYSKRVILACLLHDGSEAYLSDITRPVKQNMPEYKIIEKRLQDAIYKKFLGSVLTEEETELVKNVDDTCLYHEFKHYMGEELSDAHTELKSLPDFTTRDMKTVEQELVEMVEGYKLL